MSTGVIVDPNIEYPDDDGLPMSDNSLQFAWILYLASNLEMVFQDDPEALVAGNMLWYPVEGEPTIRMAPDVFVVFGRPKHDRGSYQQWMEDDVPITVAFEILSPGNREAAMETKRLFYERYGVDEYYIYDPETHELSGFLREDDKLIAIQRMDGWTSPNLGIRFDLSNGPLQIFDPDGISFRKLGEVVKSENQVRKELQAASRRAVDAKRRADAEKQRADRLAEKLRKLGIDPES